MIRKITIIASFYGVSAGILITLLFVVSAVTTPKSSPIEVSVEDMSLQRSVHSLTAVEPPPATPVRRAPPPPTPTPRAPEPQKLASLGAMVPPSSQLTAAAPEAPEPEPIAGAAELAAAPDLAAPARAAKAPSISSAPTITEEEVVGVVRKKKGQVKACYEKELKTEPDLIGVVQVAWTVTAGGSVRNVKILTNSTGNQDMETCIERTIGGWNFPSSGAGVDIEYPFKFRPAF